MKDLALCMLENLTSVCPHIVDEGFGPLYVREFLPPSALMLLMKDLALCMLENLTSICPHVVDEGFGPLYVRESYLHLPSCC